MVDLHYREYGSGDPIVILHGLLGNGSNWAAYAKWLTDDLGYRVILPDMRNHGRSPHAPDTAYAAMAEDLGRLLDALDLPSSTLAGHSMGGKIAMYLALARPERVRRLCVIDIAPVDYPARHLELLETMAQLKVERFTDREAIDDALAASIPEQVVRQFVMTNLQRRGNHFTWRVNLPVLREQLDKIMGFDFPAEAAPYTGPTLFIDGADSIYIEDDHYPVIERWFPGATVHTIPDAGHWVHAEQPELFRQTLSDWLADA